MPSVLRNRVLATVLTAALVGCLWAGASGGPSAELDRLLYEALQLFESGEYEESLDGYRRAVELSRELSDSAGEARGLNGQAWCLFRLGDVDGALVFFEEARVLAEAAVLLVESGEAYNGIARCKREMGLRLRLDDRIDEATSKMQDAVDAGEAALEVFREAMDEEGQARALATLGSCYGVLGNYKSAIAYYEESLAHSSAPRDRAKLLLTIGQLHAYRLDYRRAFDVQSEAVTLFRTIGDPSGLAASLYHQGYCAMRLAEYQVSVDLSREALEVYTAIGHTAGAAASLNNLGMCLRLLSDYPLAIETFERSLPLARALAATGGGARLEADALYGLGLCHSALGDLDDAISRLIECLPIYQEVGRETGDWVGLGNCYGALGGCLLKRGDTARAIEHLEAARNYYARSSFAPGVASASIGLGEAYEARSEMPEASHCFGDALGLAEALQLTENAWRAHWGLGRIARAEGQLGQARGHYEEAIAIVEGVRAGIGMERQARSYFSDVRSLYEDFLDLLLEMGAAEDVLVYAERGRTRQLLDMLAGHVTSAADAAYGATADGAVDSQEVHARIEEAWKLLTADEVALVYAWGSGHLFTWAVSADGVSPVVVQEVRQIDVIDRVCSFRALLEGSATERWLAGEELVWLYRLLVEPIESELSGKSTWIIVPSGTLWFVPFAALRRSTEEPHVIEEHALAYAPSLASIPSLLEGRAPAMPAASSMGLTALARADALLPAIQAGLAERLSGAALTAASILAGGDPTFADSVSEGVAVRMIDAKHPRYLIFACHGVFRPDNPVFSYLALMPGEGEDGNLEAREVLRIEGLKGTELAVLMACETFLTSFASQQATAGAAPTPPEEQRRQTAWNLTRADELVGLSRSFLLAGCAAVLATHWQVYVPAAAELLPFLAEEIAADASKAVALQRAQLRLMQIREFAQDPWKWSPFLLIGDWR